MWQSIDMNELAKPLPVFIEKTRQATVISGHLRDFSHRILPDEALEILDQQIDQVGVDSMQDNHSAEETMAPFSVEKPSSQEEAEAVDLDAIRAEAFNEGKEAAELAYTIERAKLVEAHRLALVETRQTTINTIAHDLVTTCAQAFNDLQSAIEDHLVRLIAPLVGDKLTDSAIAEFTQQLVEMAIDEHLPLRIEGPKPLLDAFLIQAKRETDFDETRYHLVEVEVGELRLSYKDQVLSTRIAPLLQQLREMM